ncbi:MAG: hypothetical protein GF384_01680, partial [Elusimicrobia bacterium]|nr:hypothetical protein [Elusimicrobiota bacterium]MBD3411712.1 hypothetical protein [Elusimicrobiota bacterium]
MNEWQDVLYNAKKSFYQRSRFSPEHVKLKRALELVEKEITPISKELEDRRKELERTKAELADAQTQVRLSEYQKDKEIENLKKEFSAVISTRLHEKELLHTAQMKEYEERIEALTKTVEQVQSLAERVHTQQSGIELKAIENLQSILTNERLEHKLIVARKDDEIKNAQERLLDKENSLQQLAHTLTELDHARVHDRKQWMEEVSFSRDMVKQTLQELDRIHHDYVQHESRIIQDYHQQVLTLRRTLAQLERNAPQTQIEDLTSQLNEKNDMITAQTEELAVLRSSLKELDDLPHIHRELEQKTAELTAATQRIADLEAAHATVHSQIDALKQKIFEQEKTIADLNNRAAQAQKTEPTPADTVRINELTASLERERDGLKNQVQHEATKTKRMTDALKEKEQEINRLTQMVKNLQENLVRSPAGSDVEIPTVSAHTHFSFIPNVPELESQAIAPQKTESEQTEKDKTPAYKKLLAGRMRRSAIVGTCLLITLAGAGWWAGWFSGSPVPTTFDQGYASPGSNPSGLMWDGLTFWSTDWYAKKIYKHTPHSLSEISESFQLQGIMPTSFTWGDGSMWVVDSWHDTIYQLNPHDNFSINQQFSLPESASVTGIAWDGRYLWTCDKQSRRINQRDIRQGLKSIVSYDAPGPSPSGLMWDGDTLWSCDRMT